MSKTLGSLSVGAKIEVPVLSAYQSRFGSKIVFKIADKNHSGYPSNSVTLITEKIIQNMASDAKEPSNSNSDRKSYGNNRHIYSNLLQWLNSNAAAGAWYSAKHSADQARIPSPSRSKEEERRSAGVPLQAFRRSFPSACPPRRSRSTA